MLQPDPADRPQSMRALVGAAAQQGRRRADSAAGRERPVGGRTRLVPIVGAVAVLALVAGGGWYWYEFIRTTGEASATGSGQEASATSTSTTATPGESQTQATPVVVDQTTTTPLTADAADATQATPAAASTDTATVAADSGQVDATAAAESLPIVDTSSTSTDVSASTNESPSATTPPDGGQPADTQVALLPQTLDIDRLRDDANRAVQGLSCAGIRIDAAAGGDITASGYAGSEADRDEVARLLQGVPNVGRIENAVVVMPWPLCGAMDAVREQAAFNLGLPSTPGIQPGGDNGVYREGDHLLIGVTAPDFDGYLYLDYFDAAEGYVVHLLPNDIRQDNRVRAGQQVVIGDLPQEEASYKVNPPFGDNLLIAIASPEPLFDRPRPHVEQPADDYVAALRSSLERARQGGASNLSASSAKLVFKGPD